MNLSNARMAQRRKKKERKERREKIETELATRIPPLLLTVAIFCLGFISNMENPGGSIIDEVSSIFAALCLISASLLIDFLLDQQEIDFLERVKFLNGGYLLFSATISFAVVLVAVIYLYRSGLYFCKNCEIDSLQLTIAFILLGLTTISLFAKMMTIDVAHISLYMLSIFSVLSVVWLFQMNASRVAHAPAHVNNMKCCCPLDN
jgi:hypothetical protein